MDGRPRRGSVTSIRSSTSTIADLSSRPASAALTVKVFAHKNYIVWYDAWTRLKKGAILTVDDLFEILKLLYEEAIGDTACIHLLSLIEDTIPYLDDGLASEQLAGSLLAIKEMGNRRSVVFNRRLLSVVTSIILSSEDDSLLPVLIPFLENDVNNIIALECLSAIKEAFPSAQITAKLPIEDMTAHLLSGLSSFPSESTFNYKSNPRLLNYSLMAVMSKVKGDSVLYPPSIFKSFLLSFLSSYDVYQVHLLILLFRDFDLQIFSSEEEFSLLRHLPLLPTSQQLMVSHRLFILDLVSSVMPTFKERKLKIDLTNFIPVDSDGPDTLEHKLRILVQGPQEDISDGDFLMYLKPLESLSLEKDNIRATRALYRILDLGFEVRPSSLPQRIEALIISLILASPTQHSRHILQLLKKRPDIVPKVGQVILKKVLTSDEAFTRTHSDLIELFALIEWFLQSQAVTQGIGGQLMPLFKFLVEKTRQNKSLMSNLLSCAASTIRSYESLTEDEKKVLKDVLAFVTQEAKSSDVTLTSWAQIYSIAIDSLTQGHSIKTVFEDDKEEMKRVRSAGPRYLSEGQSTPIRLRKRAKEETKSSHCQCHHGVTDNEDNKFTVDFMVSLDTDVHPGPLYAVRIEATSSKQSFQEVWQTPLLSASRDRNMRLSFQLKSPTPFNLKFRSEFHDSSGNSFRCYLSAFDIPFRDIILPLRRAAEDDESFREEWMFVKSGRPSLESVIRLEEFRDVEAFLDSHSWLVKFVVKGNPKFYAMKVLPSSILLFEAKLVEAGVNLHLMTNDPPVAKLLQAEVRSTTK